VAVLAKADYDNARFVAVLMSRGCRVDGNDDALKRGHVIQPDAERVNDGPRPQRTLHVLKDFGVNFLTAEPGAGILAVKSFKE
jgi:hypothetical protein